MSTVDTSTESVQSAAARLRQAIATHTPCSPVRDLIGADDVQAAYAVQHVHTAERVAAGGTITGHKIGLTSPAVQAQLGVDQPDFGVLFADMECPGGQVNTAELIQPKVEAEVAFVLAADLIDGDLDADQVRAAVDYAVPALEIVDSRIENWDITFGDTVADNGSSAKYVLGARKLPLRDYTPVESEMVMTVDDRTVSTGNGAACLGDPLNALAWLARNARELGQPLRAGSLVLSGALGPMAVVHQGNVVRAEISGLGTVTAHFN